MARLAANRGRHGCRWPPGPRASSAGGAPLGLSLPALRAFIAPMSAGSLASLREAAAGRATPVARLSLSQIGERVVTAATRDSGSGSLAEMMLKKDEEVRALCGSCARCGGIAAVVVVCTEASFAEAPARRSSRELEASRASRRRRAWLQRPTGAPLPKSRTLWKHIPLPRQVRESAPAFRSSASICAARPAKLALSAMLGLPRRCAVRLRRAARR